VPVPVAASEASVLVAKILSTTNSSTSWQDCDRTRNAKQPSLTSVTCIQVNRRLVGSAPAVTQLSIGLLRYIHSCHRSTAKDTASRVTYHADTLHGPTRDPS